MADINGYQGNAGLAFGSSTGGGDLGVFKAEAALDASEKLARYQFEASKDMWERANEEKDKLAKDAAAKLAFKVEDWLPEDAQVIFGNIGQLQSEFVKNPNAASLRFGPDGKVTNGDAYLSFNNNRTTLDGQIARANTRKAQAIALRAQVDGIKDKDTRDKAEAFYQSELKKPISEDITLYPDYEYYDLTKDLKEAFVDTKFTTIKRNPNDNEETNFVITDFPRGVATMNSFYTMRPKMRAEVDAQLKTFQGLLDDPKVRDEETGRIDEAKLIKFSPIGKSIVDMSEKSNAYIDDYNKLVDEGKVPGPKQDKIDLSDGLNDVDEYFRMVASGKLGASSATESKQTNNANEQAKLAIDRQRLGLESQRLDLQLKEYQDGKLEAAAVGELPNLAFYNLGKQAIKGQKTKENPKGLHVEVTNEAYQNAFAIKTNGKQKIKSEDQDGNEITTEVDGTLQPTRVLTGYLDSNKDGPNDFTVTAEYVNKDGKVFYKRFRPEEAYAQMSYISGNSKDVSPLSKAQTAFRLSKNGINTKTIKWTDFQKYYNTNGPAATSESKPASGSSITVKGKVVTREVIEKAYNSDPRRGSLTLEQYIEKLKAAK